MTTHVIGVCVDCAHHIAFGDAEGQDDRWPGPETIERNWPTAELSLGCECASIDADWDETCPDDAAHEDNCPGSEFSWSACEACGSTLGGQRIAVIARVP